MDVPVLRDPKPKKSGPRSEKWPAVVQFLDEHPGEWAYVGDYSLGIAPAIRRGEYPAFFPEGFDGDHKAYMDEHYEITVTTIGTDRRKCEVYIRKIG